MSSAPFSNDMRLGQGFNTYTQELRLEGAVRFSTIDKPVTTTTSNVPVNTPTTKSAANGISPPPTPQLFPPTPSAQAVVEEARLGKQDIIGVSSVKLNDVVNVPAIPDPKESSNAKMVAKNIATLGDQTTSDPLAQLFVIPPGPVKYTDQSVTFSVRAVNNMSDVMDALNISASTSIKYGTIHGNASAAYVNEDKILDSQLNYIVSVKVNNHSDTEPEDMEFVGLDMIPPNRFTEIYGDCFIAGFQEGGEFNAIISIDCHDKSKYSRVKEEIELQLAIPAVPGLSVGASQLFDKSHFELLQGVEITISVNWVGGGELKPPGVPWTLQTVVAAANAFHSMVARESAKTSAILKPYTSLRSFITWQFNQGKACRDLMDKETDATKKTRLEEEGKHWEDKSLILNYAPCAVYTADLFDAYLAYKKLWKRISFIMSDTSKWKPREFNDVMREIGSSRRIVDTPMTAIDPTIPPTIREPSRRDSRRAFKQPDDVDKDIDSRTSTMSQGGESTVSKDFAGDGVLTTYDTFPVANRNVVPDWNLDRYNQDRTPISLDPVELNEARILCREAMTLITEEAAHLVNHPDLAYAQYDEKTKETKMKRPNYVYPEVLKARLPKYIRNDAAQDATSRDPAVMKLKMFTKGGEMFSHLVGDAPSHLRTYKSFCSLEKNEDSEIGNPLIGLSIHGYAHKARYYFSKFSAESHMAIGGIGFRFKNDKQVKEDGCSQWEGDCDFDIFKKLSLANPAKDWKKSMDESKPKPTTADYEHRWQPEDQPARALHPEEKATDVLKESFGELAVANKNISKIDIFWVPGSGRISGLTFYDATGMDVLNWKQWDQTGRPPANIKHESQEPPKDGRYAFVGLMGDWDYGTIGGYVLARVSGIWRKS